MMPLENQVCSLQYAKRLKELGVEQKSLFYYHALGPNNYWHLYYYLEELPEEYNCKISAYTVAELGELLPYNIKEDFTFTQLKYHDGFVLSYDLTSYGDPTDSLYDQKDINEANARAKMLVCLLENKLI